MLVVCDATQHCTNGKWEAPKSTIFVVIMIQNHTYLYTELCSRTTTTTTTTELVTADSGLQHSRKLGGAQ